ncbi:glycosyltransferase [Lactococcus raffinolactis]|uniref:glycosyltransferase n=1 Tax=Pseudolactococcus raffinolactis TaxID=1366 RepID=UPI00289132CF|nr:glycosyltransferase [Lactococcus raffinolactis]MDT2767085.1 glycosyltransferase [Lactococcus raffinolactis]MDT2790221.1 glycosyltransferase [Lactococcus raffinolactis]
MTTTVHVVQITDETYLMPTSVAITSMKENKNGSSKYIVHVVSVGLSSESKNKLFELQEENFIIDIVEQKTEQAFLKLTKADGDLHVKPAATVKFKLPEIFPHIDKILYLDGDVLVKKDLTELYNTDLNGKYAGVVKDIISVRNPKHMRFLKTSHQFYFNSGVMLLNLETMREDHISEALVNYRVNGINHFMDQDALNIVFRENVRYISPMYNLLNKFYDWMDKKQLSEFYQIDMPETAIDSFNEATIIHLGSHEKPWIYEMGFLSNLYKKYHSLSPFKNEELQLIPSEKNDKLKVSVIVPVYNQEKYLRECLDSLVAQTLKEAEFIIINDGSTDCSIDIMNEYQEKDPRFVLIDKQNEGVGKTINLGISMAKGEYIAELDSDDYVSPEMYENLYQISTRHNVDIIKSDVWNFTGSGDDLVLNQEKAAPQDYYNRVIRPHEENEVFSFPIYAWTSLYRASLLKNNNIIWNGEVSSYNDNGFFWQTMSNAKTVFYVSKAYIYHRRDNENSTVKDVDKLLKNFFIEHEFIKAKLIDNGTFDEIKGYFYERKIANYFFALQGIPFEHKKNFLKLIAESFADDINNGGLETSKFVDIRKKWRILEIYRDYERYFYTTYLPEWFKVSIVVPVHNAQDTIDETLKSILNQTLREIEVILVENGSTDNTLEIINEYATKDVRVKVISIGESNAGHARNVGMDYAHSEYIIFLDADDVFDKNLLKLTYEKAINHKAEVVWVDSVSKDQLSGRKIDHSRYSFAKNKFPKKLLFKFSEIKGNPYRAFNGWTWDKLFSLKYLRNHGFRFQEQQIANDGYFTYLSMTIANRIATIDKKLVTHIIHDKNGSLSSHDENFQDGYNMLIKVIDELNKEPFLSTYKENFILSSVTYLRWLLSEGFEKAENASKLFDLLVDKGLEKLGIAELDHNDFKGKEKLEIEYITSILQYDEGEYSLFKDDIANGLISRITPSVAPNRKKNRQSARIVFGQPSNIGDNTAAGLLSIVLENKVDNNVYASIDFIYMDHFDVVNKNTLNLSLYLQKQNGKIKGIVQQAAWEKSGEIFTENVYYSFIDNIFTIHVAYTERYTGFSVKINNTSTRDGYISFSTEVNTEGYLTEKLPKISDKLTKISNLVTLQRNDYDFISRSAYGKRAIFRVDGEKTQGIRLFSVELPKYAYNNVVMSVEFINLLNNLPAKFDTFRLGIVLRPSKSGELELDVFQSEWLYRRSGLHENIYYYIRDNQLIVGARYSGLWTGYNYKITQIAGREYNEDFIIEELNDERIEGGLQKIPDSAVFVNGFLGK